MYLETIASNKRKSFEKLRVEGVNLAVEAGSPGSNEGWLKIPSPWPIGSQLPGSAFGLHIERLRQDEGEDAILRRCCWVTVWMDQNLGNTLDEDKKNTFLCLSVGIKPQRRSSSPPTNDQWQPHRHPGDNKGLSWKQAFKLLNIKL